MSEHRVTIAWRRETADFSYETYGRDHVWRFEGGAELAASSTPDFGGNRDLVDPEQAFVAALSSCHMLTFLAVAARRRLVVDRYEDEAVGILEKNEEGRLAITRVVLRPRVSFGGETRPSIEELERLHELAHKACFIANSVRTIVTLEPA